ncbi:MAG: carph-isopro domain-containing protein [Pseudomonadota bacterium]
MDELKRAIGEAGGVTALARLLGISQSRVSNWLTRESIPDGWLQVIRIRFPAAANDPQASQRAEQGVANA